MIVPDDPGFWGDPFKWLLGVLAALIGAAWGDNKFAVRKLESKMDTKADKSELDRQRDNVNTLFEGQTEIRREIQATGEKLTATLHGIHVDLLSKIDERRERR